MGVFVESPTLAELLGKGFDTEIIDKAYKLQLITIPDDESDSGFEKDELRWMTVENGKAVVYETEPHVSLWRRVSVGLLSILVLESLL